MCHKAVPPRLNKKPRIERAIEFRLLEWTEKEAVRLSSGQVDVEKPERAVKAQHGDDKAGRQDQSMLHALDCNIEQDGCDEPRSPFFWIARCKQDASRPNAYVFPERHTNGARHKQISGRRKEAAEDRIRDVANDVTEPQTPEDERGCAGRG